jgi:hypothetical protein
MAPATNRTATTTPKRGSAASATYPPIKAPRDVKRTRRRPWRSASRPAIGPTTIAPTLATPKVTPTSPASRASSWRRYSGNATSTIPKLVKSASAAPTISRDFRVTSPMSTTVRDASQGIMACVLPSPPGRRCPTLGRGQGSTTGPSPAPRLSMLLRVKVDGLFTPDLFADRLDL